jgi:hypothetical protein
MLPMTENGVETAKSEQVLHFSPSDRGVGVQSMQIASGVANSFPATDVEVKAPPSPVFINGHGLDAGLSFSTPVAPLIEDKLLGSLLPQTPPCPEMKELLPTNLATCTLPAAVYPCKQLGLLAPVSFSEPPRPLPLDTREIQSPGLHFIFSVECFTLPGSSL